jgi:hypothetical protein
MTVMPVPLAIRAVAERVWVRASPAMMLICVLMTAAMSIAGVCIPTMATVVMMAMRVRVPTPVPAGLVLGTPPFVMMARCVPKIAVIRLRVVCTPKSVTARPASTWEKNTVLVTGPAPMDTACPTKMNGALCSPVWPERRVAITTERLIVWAAVVVSGMEAGAVSLRFIPSTRGSCAETIGGIMCVSSNSDMRLSLSK